MQCLDAQKLTKLKVSQPEAIQTQGLSEAFLTLLHTCKALESFTITTRIPLDEPEIVQAIANQLEVLAAMGKQQAVTFHLNLSFSAPGEDDTPLLHEHQALDVLAKVQHHVEHIGLSESFLFENKEADLPLPTFPSIKSANINFSNEADDLRPVVLHRYVSPMFAGSIDSLALDTPPVRVDDLEQLTEYLARMPVLRTLGIMCPTRLQPTRTFTGKIWQDIKDVLALQKQADAWVRFAQECSHRDIAYIISWSE